MAQKIGELYASMSLNSAAFISGLERATKSTDRASRAIEQGMDRAKTAVKGFAAVFAADKLIDGSKKYLELADANKKMEAQARLATATFGNQGIAMRDVHNISKETRSEMQGVSDLYNKFMPTTKELGRSQVDNARAVETFTKAMKVSQATTQEQQSAQLQMGQALSGTNVQWEELGQIMDASPRLTRLFTESLGVTRGELKKMAEEGKLTSKMLYDALTNTKMTSQIDAEFKELPKTMEDAKVLMENSLMDLVGAFDRGAGISDSLVEGLGEGNTMMESLVAAAEEAGVDIRAHFEGLNNVFDPLGEGAAGVFDFIRKDADYTRETIGNLLRFIDKAHNAYAAMDNWGTNLENGFKRGMNRAIDRAGGGQHFQEKPLIEQWHMGDDYDAGYQRSKVQSARDKLVRNIKTYGGKEYRNFTGKGMTDAQLQGVSAKVTADIQAGRTVERGTGRGPKAAVDEKALKAAERERKKREREAARAARQAEREAEEQRRNQEAYKADKNRSEREELDSKAALATVGKERFNFERQELDQDRKSRLDQIDKDGPQGSKKYSEAQVAELKAIEERITANRRQKINLDEAEFQQHEALKLKSADLANAEDLAQLESGPARTAKDRRAVEYRLLDLRMAQEKLALEAIIASRDSTDAEKKIAKARFDLLPKLQAGEQKAIDRNNMGPLAGYLDAIPRGANEINEALENVEIQGLDSLQSGLLDAIKGVGSLSDAFGNMADAVIDGLLRIALQQMLIKPLGNLLFGTGGEGGGGGLFGALVGGITKVATGGKGVTGKANGGMGNRGRYLVGEHGPEHVDIGGPFHVTPNSKLDSVRGGGQPAMNITFGAITSNDPAAVKAMATQAIAEMMPMINQNAANHTMSKLQRPRM